MNCEHLVEIPIEEEWVDDFGQTHIAYEYDVLWTLKKVSPGTLVCTQCGEIIRDW